MARLGRPSTQTNCNVCGCDRSHYGGGYCRPHFQRGREKVMLVARRWLYANLQAGRVRLLDALNSLRPEVFATHTISGYARTECTAPLKCAVRLPKVLGGAGLVMDTSMSAMARPASRNTGKSWNKFSDARFDPMNPSTIKMASKPTIGLKTLSFGFDINPQGNASKMFSPGRVRSFDATDSTGNTGWVAK